MSSNSNSKVDSEKSGSQKYNEYSFEEAFELTGHGKFNHIVLLTCGLILLNVTMESVGMGYVITAAQCDLHLTSRDKGLVNASAFIGIIATSFLWGYLGDRFGRKAVMLPSILVSAIVSILSSFSVNVWMLVILRLLTGCFVSASSATVYAYLGELHTNTRRSAAIAWGSAFISFAFILLPGLAWLIIPGKWSLWISTFEIRPWRVLMWFWCIPGLVSALVLAFLPESPRLLLARGFQDEAREVLERMYRWNYSKDGVESFPVSLLGERHGNHEVKRLLLSDSCKTDSGFSAAKKNILRIFKPPLLKCVFISYTSMFAVFMLSSGLYLWAPDIINNILNDQSTEKVSICKIIHMKFDADRNASLSNVTASSICDAKVSVGVFPLTMGMGFTFAVTYFFIGFVINKIGRVPLYSGIMAVCGVATAATAFVPHGAVATALMVLALCSGCAGSILAAVAVEVFPTNMRAMAMCLLYMVGRAGAAVGTNLLGVMLDTQCQPAFTLFGAISIVSAVVILFWPKPEKIREEMESKGLTY